MVYDWNLHIIYTKGKITWIAFSKNNAFTFPRIEHQLIIIKPMTCDRGITIDYRLYHFRIVIILKKILLSSAQLDKLAQLRKQNRSLRKILKRRGPKTDPRGTPLKKTTTSEVTSFILICQDLSLMLLCTRARPGEETPQVMQYHIKSFTLIHIKLDLKTYKI